MEVYCPYCMNKIEPESKCPNCGRTPSDYCPSSHHIPPNTLLNERYVVGKCLGEGGFGITYLGIDTELNRKVAIKEYFPNVFVYREASIKMDVTCYTGSKTTQFEKGRQQFLEEARVMARLDDVDEIVRVLDHFATNNTAYIIMECLTGKTLRQYLAEQGRVPAKYLLNMMEPMVRAINVMHGAGIIHRDISPDNIMLLNSGKIKLLDFGCARDVDSDHTMTVMLKHGYAPPEQYTGYDQGPWTDVYALCATLYHCLTGQAPPSAMDRMAGNDPIISLKKLGAGLTDDQEQAIMKGLAVKAKDRWQSMAGLYAGLYGTVIKDFPWAVNEKQTEIVEDDEVIKRSDIASDSSDNKLKSKKSKEKLVIGVISACLLIILAVIIIKTTSESGESALSTDIAPAISLPTSDVIIAGETPELEEAQLDNVTPTEIDPSEVEATTVSLVGHINGTEYTNDFFNIKYTLNNGMEYLSDSALKASNGLAYNSSFADEATIREYIKSRSDGYYDMYALKDGSLPNVNATIMYIAQVGGEIPTYEQVLSIILMNSDYLLDNLSMGLESSGAIVTETSAGMTTQTICNAERSGIYTSIQFSNQGIPSVMNQYMTCFIENEYALQIVVTYQDEEDLIAILNSFSCINAVQQNIYQAKKSAIQFEIPDGWYEKDLYDQNTNVLEAKFSKSSDRSSNSIIIYGSYDIYAGMVSEDPAMNGVSRSDVDLSAFSESDLISLLGFEDATATRTTYGNNNCIMIQYSEGISPCETAVLVEKGYLYMFTLYDMETKDQSSVLRENEDALILMVQTFESFE